MAERSGVYTAFDYADIMEFLIKKWKVGLLRMQAQARRLAQLSAAPGGFWPVPRNSLLYDKPLTAA